MLIQLADYLKSKNILNIWHVGEVVDNADPAKICRVRVRIDGMIEGGTSSLPWMAQLNLSSGGMKGSNGSISIPEVGSLVVVIFPYGNIYNGMYLGALTMKSNIPSIFFEDYPNTYGSIDSSGNILKINKVKGTVDVIHSSGSYMHIACDGKTTVSSPEVNIHYNGGETVINSRGTWNHLGIINNEGTINNLGDINNEGQIGNKGNITNTGNVGNVGIIANTGNLTNTGSIVSTGDVVGAGKSLSTHKHSETGTGGGITSTPI